jgi:hypothetical protein
MHTPVPQCNKKPLSLARKELDHNRFQCNHNNGSITRLRLTSTLLTLSFSVA